MKMLLKWAGAALGTVLLLVVLFGVHTWNFRPLTVGLFYETMFLKYAIDDPELLSSMRLLEQAGITFHNNDLTDISIERTERLNRELLADLETLKSYDRSKLQGQAALSYDILLWFMENQAAAIPYTWHGYPVNQMHGEQNGLPRFLTDIHHIGSIADAEDYIERLGKVGVKFDQLIEDLTLREGKGVMPPLFTVEKVLAEMRGFRGMPARDNVLFTTFGERLGKVEGVSDERRTQLEGDVEKAIESSVYPAYDRLITFFEHQMALVTGNYGVWSLPDGDAYYDYQLSQHTTTKMTADQIHALGLSEVDRIQAEMDAILKDQGLVEGTVGERMTQLGEDERYTYPNTDQGREQILARFTEIIDEISQVMPDYFLYLPKSGVEVKRVPEFSEKGSAGAYYYPPSMDFTRPGVFYANLRDLKEHPKWEMRTLAFHEAVPGHHTQSALQMELKDVPTFRNILGFTAFAEGWALYSERLAWEAGLQSDPLDNLGRLKAELFRAVRLVVDTGIHRQRWTREQAIDYMMNKTGMVLHDAVSEIERYFVMPGQATAYKVGMIKILDLREEAKQELGEKFDIREFHDVVIGDGDMPLDVLEQQVDAWVKSKK